MRLPSVRREAGGLSGLDSAHLTPFEDQRPRQVDALGRALQGAGMATQQVAEEWQHQVDSAELKRADNLMADAMRQATFDYQSKLGADAIAGRESALKALASAREKVGQTLTTDSQREMFSAAADRRMLAATDEITRHGLQQARVFQEGETLARAEGARVDAVRTVGTPEFDMHRGLMLQQVDELATQRGLPPDSAQRAEMRLKATTDLHSAVVSSMADQEPQRAAAYLQKHQGEIEPGRASQLGQVVRRAGISEDSLQLTQRILKETVGPTGSIDMELALGIADATQKAGRISADVYDATVDRLRREDRTRRDLQATKVNEAQDAAEAWLQQNPDKGPQGLPAGLYATLEQHGKLAEINAFADRGRRVTDPQALDEALAIPPGSLSPQELRSRYRGRLSPEDLSVVLATHAIGAGKGDARDTLTLRENLEIELGAKDAGILPTDEKPQEAQSTAFDRWRLAALQARALDPKKPMAEIVREMQAQLVRARGESVDVPFFGMVPAERQTAEVVTPTGRRIPVADIVDEAGRPMVEQVLSDIRAENVRRAGTGAPPIPETLAAVGAAWERRQQNVEAGRVSSLMEEMQRRGMEIQTRQHGVLGAPMPFVKVADAIELTGLTEREIAERVGTSGVVVWHGRAGFDPKAMALLMEQLKRKR